MVKSITTADVVVFPQYIACRGSYQNWDSSKELFNPFLPQGPNQDQPLSADSICPLGNFLIRINGSVSF